MLSMLGNPSPYSGNGYWGGVPATLDWCEANYAFSPYVAEFWNTITNIPMVIFMLYGGVMCVRFGLEKRFYYAYFALGMVGFGSWCFHGSLRYDMQLLDELPMIYGTVGFLFCLFENERKPRHGAYLPFLLAALCTLFTIAYIYSREPLFHQAVYVSCVLLVIRLSYQEVTRVKQPQASALLQRAIASIILAALFWLCDNHFCVQLQATRDIIGFPLEGLLQFHGWWHLCASIPSYDDHVLTYDLGCRAMRHTATSSSRPSCACIRSATRTTSTGSLARPTSCPSR